MCLNPAKSEATPLGTSLRSFPAVHSFSVASSILTPTDKVTTIGVTLDFKLTFDAYRVSYSQSARRYTFSSHVSVFELQDLQDRRTERQTNRRERSVMRPIERPYKN